ncbi:MAG: hypothetical protein ACK4TP_03285 [Hyphomicrobium sp.]|jgi:hypothetical protein
MQLRGVALAVVGAAALVFAGSSSGLSTEKAAEAASPKAPPVSSASQAAIPDAYKLSMLIRTTLIALSQANQTGNYSVLRDLGTPQFQAMNTDARLAEIFASLRGRNLDFSPVVFFDPKLVREPTLQTGGLLRLTGFIPTEPQRILFDMGFERVGEVWRLSAIVIDVQAAPAGASSTSPAKNEKTEQPKSASKNKALPTNAPAKKPAP